MAELDTIYKSKKGRLPEALPIDAKPKFYTPSPLPMQKNTVGIGEVEMGDTAEPTTKYPELFRQTGMPEVYGAKPGKTPEHIFPGDPEGFTEAYGMEGWERIAELSPQEFTLRMQGLGGEEATSLNIQNIADILFKQTVTELGEYEAAQVTAGEKEATQEERLKGMGTEREKMRLKLRKEHGVGEAEIAEEKAYEKLQGIEAERQKAIESLRSADRTRAVPGWAMRGQMTIINNSFAAETALAKGNYNIAAHRYEIAYNNFKEAFDLQLKSMDALIKHYDNQVERSFDMSEQEKKDYYTARNTYMDFLASNYVERQKAFAWLKTNTPDANINIGMTVEDMYNAAEPYLKEIAREKLRDKTKVTGAETKKLDIGSMATQLNNVVGTDGYVSPENFKKARKAWMAAGYSGKEFNETFTSYINPDHPEGGSEAYIPVY